MRLKIDGAVQTHTGRVRTNNEDNFYLCGRYREDVAQGEEKVCCITGDSRFLAAVADGMGGEDCGELASLLTVQSLRPCDFTKIEETALSCIRRANTQICANIEKNGGRRMGSTLAALYIDKGKARCCNIGDSRVYLLRKGQLVQLSVDHNKAGRMVELGVLTPEQAARHPSRHELTQHLGIFEEEMMIQPAFSEPVSLQEDDLFLLCSDGLTDMVSKEDMVSCMTREASPKELAEKLVKLALAGGGRDNVTALVLKVSREDRPAWKRFLARL